MNSVIARKFICHFLLNFENRMKISDVFLMIYYRFTREQEQVELNVEEILRTEIVRKKRGSYKPREPKQKMMKLQVVGWIFLNIFFVFSKHFFSYNFSLQYKCLHCPQKFGERHNLDKHQRDVHERNWVFRCEFCQPPKRRIREYRRKKDLQDHYNKTADHRGQIVDEKKCKIFQ